MPTSVSGLGTNFMRCPPPTNWGLIIIFVNVYVSLIGVCQPVAGTPKRRKIKHNQINVQILDWTR